MKIEICCLLLDCVDLHFLCYVVSSADCRSRVETLQVLPFPRILQLFSLRIPFLTLSLLTSATKRHNTAVVSHSLRSLLSPLTSCFVLVAMGALITDAVIESRIVRLGSPFRYRPRLASQRLYKYPARVSDSMRAGAPGICSTTACPGITSEQTVGSKCRYCCWMIQ